MSFNGLKVNNKVFSTIFGDCVIYQITQSNGEIVQKINKDTSMIYIQSLDKKLMGNRAFSVQHNKKGHCLEISGGQRTLFKNKKHALEYLVKDNTFDRRKK